MKISVTLKATLVACFLLGVTTAIPAAATFISLQSTIDGAQASAGAGTGSPGTGLGAMTFDDLTNDFSWDISWSGLSGALTVAHFHGPAGPGTNAGVQVNFLAIAPGNPSIGTTVIDSGQAADLLAGLWYINIHTAVNPGGEIRGQVLRSSEVPEPTTLALILIAITGLVYTRRRRV